MAERLKASEKQSICNKLMALLKKKYKVKSTGPDFPALETILRAICLEDVSFQVGEQAYEQLIDYYFDLNEIRVSSISELEETLEKLPEPEFRALRLRSVLHYVFESFYDYTFEDIRRKSLVQAREELKSIESLSPFVVNYTLQSLLGSHLVPVDRPLCKLAVWLGFADPKSSNEEVAASLKPAVRKSDVPQFFCLFKSLSTDPQYTPFFEDVLDEPAEDEIPVEYLACTAISRTKDLLAGKLKKEKPAKRKQTPVTASSKKKKATKTSTKKTTTRNKGKKKSSKKASNRKAATKKKAPAKKKAATKKKTATKKTTKKKSPAKKKAATKKITKKKSPATKEAASRKSTKKKSKAKRKSATKKKAPAKKSTRSSTSKTKKKKVSK